MVVGVEEAEVLRFAVFSEDSVLLRAGLCLSLLHTPEPLWDSLDREGLAFMYPALDGVHANDPSLLILQSPPRRPLDLLVFCISSEGIRECSWSSAFQHRSWRTRSSVQAHPCPAFCHHLCTAASQSHCKGHWAEGLLLTEAENFPLAFPRKGPPWSYVLRGSLLLGMFLKLLLHAKIQPQRIGPRNTQSACLFFLT